jgi:SAM-dependent methyltransferase
VGLDLSGGMLEAAWRKIGGWTPRAQLIMGSAARAPFLDESFDAVIMLEALEFMPDPRGAVGEVARLVRPGGVVLLTNRIGWEARLMPGRAFSRTDLGGQMERAGLSDVRFEAWQTYYELVWARRPGNGELAGTWLERATCPDCGRRLLDRAQGELECGRGHVVEWRRGAWQFRRDGGAG